MDKYIENCDLTIKVFYATAFLYVIFVTSYPAVGSLGIIAALTFTLVKVNAVFNSSSDVHSFYKEAWSRFQLKKDIDIRAY